LREKCRITGVSEEARSEGNLRRAYKQDRRPESFKTAGRLTREGESVKSKLDDGA